jgi:hypothetical protein
MQSDLTQLRCYIAFGSAANNYARVQGLTGPGGALHHLQEYLQQDMDVQQLIICQVPGFPKCYMWSGEYTLEPSHIIQTRDDDSYISSGYLPYP